MDYAWSAPTLFLLASAALSALVAGFVGRRHGRIGGHCLTIIMLAATAWSAAYGLEVASRTLSGVELWGALKYVGITVWPPAYLVFALRYTGREQRVTRSLVAALSVQPLLVLGALAAPATRELMFSYPPATAADPLPTSTLGPLFWVHAAYCYVLMLVATVLIVRALSRLSRAYRGRSALLVASMALPAGANLLYLLELQPFGTIDPTPFAYVVTGAVLVWAGLRFGLRDVMPVARDAIVETMADGVVVLDPVGRVVDLNPAARTLLGPAADEATGQPAAAVLPGYRGLVERLGSALEGDGEIVIGEGAERRVLEGRISPVLDHRGGTTALLLVLRDITARRRAEEELGRLAHYDQLTGLPNRKLLGDRLEQASARARVSGEPFALVFFDLDGFKVVNDSFGHHAGDCLLAEAAARLARQVGPEDTVARLGGDEFTLLLAHVDSPHAVAGVVSEVLSDFQVPFALRGQSVHVSVSAGIAMCPADAIEADTLLRFADTAMYRAKAEGRSRYEFFTPDMSLAAVQRFELERDLRAALDERELVVHYQPLVPLQEGMALGVEALVRWWHPVRGPVPPDAFIPLAEETGLISRLFELVLEQACEQLAIWREEDGGPNFLSVNVAPRQLAEPGLLTSVLRVLAHTGVAPESLVLEVTEGALVGDLEGAHARLAAIRELGVQVALDDFGAGHASFGHLKVLPVDQLKIDRSFIAGLEHDPVDRKIVEATIELAHMLGLRVVGEGIETPAQRERLRDLGCDLGQGFGIARPMPAGDVAGFAARWGSERQAPTGAALS